MGMIATAVRHLIAAGVTGDALVTAIAEMEDAQAPQVPQRSKAAIRQQRYRDRQEPSQKHNVVTVCDAQGEATPVNLPDEVDASGVPGPQPNWPATVTPLRLVTPGGTIGGESSFLPSRDSGKKDLEIQHAREPNPVDVAVERYNAVARECGLPVAQLISATRRQKLRKRLEEAGGLPGWDEALAKIRASPGLQGKAGGNWRADLDFMLQASSFTKLMEGKYDNWKKPKPDLMAAADRLRDRVGSGNRQDAESGRAPGFFDSADGTGGMRDDHLSY